MKTTTKTRKTRTKKVNHAARARSPVVQEILTILQEHKGWVDKPTLDEKAGKLVDKDDAVAVYHYRHCDGHKCGARPGTKAYEKAISKHSNYAATMKEKIERGRSTQVMLNCITLSQTGKIEQTNDKGDLKKFRIAK
jgi:hypothetical protein